MKKTVLTHIFNEEYMLPWWLIYHREKFDHGIVIDYQSTDSSLDIVRELCPSWTVINSRNSEFEARAVDKEIYDIEKEMVEGWRCCLTATEYLLGRYELLNDEHTQHLAPVISMVDQNYMHSRVDRSKPLFEQFTYGVRYPGTYRRYYWRSIHRTLLEYSPGRHFKNEAALEDCKFIVAKYNYAPMTEEVIKRKLQIQDRIPLSDVSKNRGSHHHNNGKGLTESRIKEYHTDHKAVSTDYREVLTRFLRPL